jgi:hypothetical protein
MLFGDGLALLTLLAWCEERVVLFLDWHGQKQYTIDSVEVVFNE